MLTVDDRVPIDYRIDAEAPRRAYWSELISHEGAGIWTSEAIDFLRRLSRAKKLYIRATERDGEGHEPLSIWQA